MEELFPIMLAQPPLHGSFYVLNAFYFPASKHSYLEPMLGGARSCARHLTLLCNPLLSLTILTSSCGECSASAVLPGYYDKGEEQFVSAQRLLSRGATLMSKGGKK